MPSEFCWFSDSILKRAIDKMKIRRFQTSVT